MIQRIQSLYLLAVTAILAVTIFTPMVEFVYENGNCTLSAFGFTNINGEVQSTLWMGILLALSAVLPAITLFLYKRRNLQIRLCGVETVLLIGDLVFMVIYYKLAERAVNITPVVVNVNVGTIMPAVAIVLTLLAMRAVFRDEVLVRSVDRIR